MTTLNEIRDGWNRAAQDDAMFNILTDPDKVNGGWDPAEFFATGRREIDGVLSRLDSLGIARPTREAALDFGCGVGRLSQALTHHYEQVTGVDVSRQMVAQARKLADGMPCEFVTNSAPNLRRFNYDSFDFIYSVITLQHMPPVLQECYVREFVRVLDDDGLAVFQIPEGATHMHENPWLSMWGSSPETVEGWVRDAGAEVLDRELSNHSGPGWDGWRYTVRPCA